MTSENRGYPLSRTHHIPLRKQLAADLEAGIRDGLLAHGSKLPSSRDLARHLDVDRGTVGAAFARLRQRGLAQTTPGRRTRVESTRVGGPRNPIRRILFEHEARGAARAALSELLLRAFDTGVPRSILLDELYDLLPAEWQDPPEVTLFEPRPGLRAVLAAELRTLCEVDVYPVERLRLAPESGPVLVRCELWRRLRNVEDLEYIPISLAGGTRERGMVRRSVRRGLVVLLSRSATIREYASELAAREFDRGVSFAAIDPEKDGAATTRLLASARLVFFDRLSSAHVGSIRTPRVLVTTVSTHAVDALRRYLGTKDMSRSAALGPGAELERP